MVMCVAIRCLLPERGELSDEEESAKWWELRRMRIKRHKENGAKARQKRAGPRNDALRKRSLIHAKLVNRNAGAHRGWR